jgi:uncharacterized protein involved in propanediol utilization
MDREGTGECCGSFGELLQGVLPNGHKFLVNCRIQNRSTIRLRLTEPHYVPEKEAMIVRAHQRFPKTYKALRNLLADLGRRDDCLFEIDSDIPVGKGLSSSTADMVAGIRALSEALSVKFKNDYMSRVISEIEPNDGLHFDNTSAYLHTEGRLIANFDWVPPLRILGLDEGGTCDTVAFNRQPIALTSRQQAHYQHMLDTLSTALERRDVATVAAIATESARLWQAIYPKTDFERVLSAADEMGALGVLNTHSGTFLGILFATDATLETDDYAERLMAAFPDRTVAWFNTAGWAPARQSKSALEKVPTHG